MSPGSQTKPTFKALVAVSTLLGLGASAYAFKNYHDGREARRRVDRSLDHTRGLARAYKERVESAARARAGAVSSDPQEQTLQEQEQVASRSSETIVDIVDGFKDGIDDPSKTPPVKEQADQLARSKEQVEDYIALVDETRLDPGEKERFQTLKKVPGALDPNASPEEREATAKELEKALADIDRERKALDERMKKREEEIKALEEKKKKGELTERERAELEDKKQKQEQDQKRQRRLEIERMIISLALIAVAAVALYTGNVPVAMAAIMALGMNGKGDNPDVDTGGGGEAKAPSKRDGDTDSADEPTDAPIVQDEGEGASSSTGGATAPRPAGPRHTSGRVASGSLSRTAGQVSFRFVRQGSGDYLLEIKFADRNDFLAWGLFRSADYNTIKEVKKFRGPTNSELVVIGHDSRGRTYTSEGPARFAEATSISQATN